MQPEEDPGERDTFGRAVRRMDPLGRVVIPAEQRRILGFRHGDLLETRLEAGRVVIAKIDDGY